MSESETGALEARRVLFVHAHPDDETLASGAVITALVRSGRAVDLCTATRGERGEVVDGVRIADRPGALVAEREAELDRAAARLGIERRVFLGTPPARDPSFEPRIYEDSGMRWIAPGLAGPAASSSAASLTASDESDASGDLGALLDAWKPGLVATYDAQGGYGHPDHVAIRNAAVAAARSRRIPAAEITPTRAATPGTAWYEADSEGRDAIVEALREYRTQLRVDGDTVVHVGGQHQRIDFASGLRLIG